mmetsp:Transcript_86341/g.180691  ORF Transcript_86341/g.180691 Transcript_86341/m.180691 type:complete len:97 (-) Transcript_86341:19-309(-)
MMTYINIMSSSAAASSPRSNKQQLLMFKLLHCAGRCRQLSSKADDLDLDQDLTLAFLPLLFAVCLSLSLSLYLFPKVGPVLRLVGLRSGLSANFER